MNILVFDIETIPDVDAGRRLLELDNLSDDDVARAMSAKQIQKTGGSDSCRCIYRKWSLFRRYCDLVIV